MTLNGVANKIQCPVFVGHAEEDLLFEGQPEAVADALGEKADSELFKAMDGVGGHCQVGAEFLFKSCGL